jgi:DNA-nicking Smr family endonuclease
MPDEPSETAPNAPAQLPIDGVLDLHTFRPRQIKELVDDYLAACQRQGIREVRIIHGKGRAQLLQTVHALLKRHPEVVSFNLAAASHGGWGATVVRLRPPQPELSP